MTIKLSEKDHRALDAMIDGILKSHKDGEVSHLAARGALAHVITAAAIGNEGELRGWLKPATLDSWKSGIGST